VRATRSNDRTRMCGLDRSEAGAEASRRTPGSPMPGEHRGEVIVDVALLGGGEGLELLVGYTRLGNLLGLLDRQEVSEVQKHLVWVGRATAPD
jgi:hypothetical protein